MTMLDENPNLFDKVDVHFPDVEEGDREETEYAILEYSDREPDAGDRSRLNFSYALGPRTDALFDVELLVENIMRRPADAVSPDEAAELPRCARTGLSCRQ